MTNLRFTAALSVITAVAAFSTVAVSAAHAQEPVPAIADHEMAAELTRTVSDQLSARIAARPLPTHEPVVFATALPKGSPVRVAQVAIPVANVSLASPLPKATLR